VTVVALADVVLVLLKAITDDNVAFIVNNGLVRLAIVVEDGLIVLLVVFVTVVIIVLVIFEFEEVKKDNNV